MDRSGTVRYCSFLPRAAQFDTVKVRLQAAVTSAEHIYAGPLDCLRKTLRAEGFQGLYKGMSFPLAGTIIETATLFTANGALRRALIEAGHIAADTDMPLPVVFAAGAGSGFFVSFVLTPVELIKCRLQVQTSGTAIGPNSAPVFTGPVDCLVRSVRAEGLRVLYRGHSATLLREIPGTGMWFFSYELFLRSMLHPGQARKDLHPGVIIAAGALGGVSYWGIMYPFDTVKSAMQIVQTPANGVGSRGVSPSFSQTLRSLYRFGGMRGLYAGLFPTLLRAAPSNAAVFFVYEYAIQNMAHI